jgi:hypothetical protein
VAPIASDSSGVLRMVQRLRQQSFSK